MVNINLEAQMREADVESFLNAIRQWEEAHQNVQIAIKARGSMNSETAEELFRRLGFPVVRRVRINDPFNN